MNQPVPPVMFRAGRIPAGAAAPVMPSAAQDPGTGTLDASHRLLLSDLSEWQSNLNDAAYLRWSPAIIFRALYGAAVDKAWYGGARRAALHVGGAQFIGIYAFLVASQDAAAQAQALVHLLGPLHSGEIPICDLEEGSGDQSLRWRTWRSVILAAYPQLHRTPLGGPMLYSGEYFAATHNLRPDWVAAYQATEPAAAHRLWQFTDTYPVPGVGTCDCSSFNGTISELAALIRPAPQPPVRVPPRPAPRPAPAPAPAPAVTPADEENGMPTGTIKVGAGVRESHTWPAGTVKQITVWSDWEGIQTSAPIVDLRIGHIASPVYDAGSMAFTANTATYLIGNPADCAGCSFTRHDTGPATVAWRTA